MRKQLLVAALVTAMSVLSANATDITGAQLQNGIYNINPEKINGDVGYRSYSNFDLSKGDVAKLIYQGYKGGEIRDLNTFINLVNNEVKIDGVLNAVKADGTGHAIFITPSGFTVGQHGVLNVGTLSVITPTADKFSALDSDYKNNNFVNINQISKMRNNAAINGNNHGGNAPVNISGHIFTRKGADIRGSQVIVGGGIVNGYKPANDFTANNFDGKSTAAALFASLVNTNGIVASADQISTKGSSIVIKSGAGSTEYNHINVSGKIANLDNGETVLTNHGDAGLTLKGATIAGNGKVNIYNNNAVGNLTISEDLNHNPSLVVAHKGNLSVTSKGGMNVAAVNRLVAKDNVEIVNKGGALNFAGSAIAGDRIDVVNSGAQGANISGNLGTASQKSNTVRIVNENGKLVFAGNANAAESVSIRNQENGESMTVTGNINAAEGVLIHNKSGDAVLNGKIEVETAKVENDIENVSIAIFNEGDGKLSTGSSSNIISNDGNIAIKNAADNGMDLAGAITNKNGETAINNTNGAMDVDGTINSTGNTGIINRGEGKMTIGASVNNEGDLKLSNVNGEDFEIKGNITNKDGNFNIYNKKGSLDINSDLENSNGYLYIYSKDNSEGVTTAQNTEIKNTNGDIAVKHDGKGTDMLGNGINLKGNITKDGQNGEVAINNYNGDMSVNGVIMTNSNTGIVNRKGSDDLNVNAKIISDSNKELRIKNEVGTGDLTVGGDIIHDGRLNILTNDGTLTLDGKVTNVGSDRTYAITRNQADGIVVTEKFNAQSTKDGMIYILNKSGEDGMNYSGTASAANAQVELYNMKGDMDVKGGVVRGNPTIILNKGDKMTVSNSAMVDGKDVKIVNKGSQAAEIGSNYTKYFKEQLK